MERNRWQMRCLGGLVVVLSGLLFVGCDNSVATTDPHGQPAPADPAEDPTNQPPGASDGQVVQAANVTDKNSDPDANPPRDPAEPAPMADVYPFRNRIDIPDFPVDAEWLNSRPLTKADLKGKFVLLDFWTYCCINCIHILPELKKLEQKYPNELVVIGVHCAKFDAEEDKDNIRNAVMRYEIEHPVLNDPKHDVWEMLGVNSWPTILLLDPEGKAVMMRSGEFKADFISRILDDTLPFYREKGLLNEEPIKFDLERSKLAATSLQFPGKILADEAGKRLFISDSNHNRIVVTDLTGKVQSIIGSGKQGKDDGPATEASFHHPQGVALTGDGKTLYVADNENHMIRKVDLATLEVKTVAGTGKQAESPWPGLEGLNLTSDIPERFVGQPHITALSNPWDLWIHGDTLYIAMAGTHQIWSMPLDESEIGPFAGNSYEDIVDGAHLPRFIGATGSSSFAQPSGLSSDGKVLFVADSEGSSIRAVPFDPAEPVTTVVGSNDLLRGRLFAFGDADGPRETAKFQHALGVTYANGKVYVADTYNNKIKEVDAESGESRTLAGDGQRGSTDDPPRFSEPAGISIANGILYIADTNNHLIRTLDPATGKVGTLSLTGFPDKPAAAAISKPSATAQASFNSDLSKSKQEQIPLSSVKPVDGKVTLHVSLVLPTGWKINPDAPMAYQLDFAQEQGPLDRKSLGKHKLEMPVTEFNVEVPAAGEGDDGVSVALRYYYCEDVKSGEGTCKIGNVVFTVPIKVSAASEATSVELKHQVDP